MTDYKALIEAAAAARLSAYAPYSDFWVGAALAGKSGRIYTGCNVESAAYSPTCCAERTALVKAVSEGEKAFEAIAIVAGKAGSRSVMEEYVSPCGVCRQMLAEFDDGGMRVILARSPEDYRVYTLGELFPLAFDRTSL
jgi:homotetrameric cytidine deaminase